MKYLAYMSFIFVFAFAVLLIIIGYAKACDDDHMEICETVCNGNDELTSC